MIGIAVRTLSRRAGPGRAALAIGAVVAMLALAPTSALASAPHDNAKGEAELTKLLKDRVPGKPVDCIDLIGTQDSTIIDHTAIVYGNGGTLYVNRPQNPEQLDSNDILVTRTSLSQLCSVDIVRLIDRGSHMESGFVSLSQFVPYNRPPKDGGRMR